VIAVLDALGIERVKLVGHDWGGWVGFLLALRDRPRLSHFLALNILHPWPRSLGAALPHAWRFSYQFVILAPLLGYHLHRSGNFIPRVLVGGSTRRGAWDEQTLRAFGENLAEPGRARACVQVYRTFQRREILPVVRGRYAERRLTVPTRVLFGEDDTVLRPALLAGYERHADDMQVELVPECGHFIVDERPQLVAERARAFLAPA
jgi:pimeloyl-ACP methyl ester carboxylesterase